jgi:molybdate transport system substrate-binding protein
MAQLRLMSGGAAQGLVGALRQRFETESGFSVDGRFGAVGIMRDQLLAGDPCDLMILSQSLIDELTQAGHLVAGSARALGVVKTGVALLPGAARAPIETPEQLRALLANASAVYFPDPAKATAGIHFVKVLDQLGLRESLAPRLCPYPNGATAMREMAAQAREGAVGCTQVTEILYTPGVELIGPLPPSLGLSTVYTAAICTRASQPEAARQLIDLLAGNAAASLRSQGGFEPLT